jgi:hypothetical protein
MIPILNPPLREQGHVVAEGVSPAKSGQLHSLEEALPKAEVTSGIGSIFQDLRGLSGLRTIALMFDPVNFLAL